MEKSFKETYEKNSQTLKNYKFWRENIPLPKFDELNYKAKVVDADEKTFAVFDEKNQTLGEPYKIIHTKQPQKPFFRDLSKQLLVKNEFNSCHWDYLVSNVRRSEDYGSDNHIYMYYDSEELFYLLLQTVDISEFLKDEKIIFLIGEEDLKENYPLDFVKLYGIDYDKFEPQPLRICEINRLHVVWSVGSYCGNFFFTGILDYHKNLLTTGGLGYKFSAGSFSYLYENFLKNRSTVELKNFLENKSNTNIFKIIHSMFDNDVAVLDIHQNTLSKVKVNWEKIFANLQKIFDDDYVPSKIEWLKAIYLAYSQCLNRNLNQRIAPMLNLETHIYNIVNDKNFIFKYLNTESMYDVFCEFKFFRSLSIMRHPTSTLGSLIQGEYGAYSQSHWIPFYYHAVSQSFINPHHGIKLNGVKARNIQPLFVRQNDKFLLYRAVVRFEDLKLYPKATLESLCDFLDIEWDDNLLKTTYDNNEYLLGGMSTKKYIGGFDVGALYHKHEKLLSPFDHYRIELLSEYLMKAYGYKPVYHTDGIKYTPEEIAKLCEVHFKFEDVLNQNKTDSEYNNYIWVAKKYFAESVRAHFAMDVGKAEDGTQLVPIPMLKPKKEFMKDGDKLYTNGLEE